MPRRRWWGSHQLPPSRDSGLSFLALAINSSQYFSTALTRGQLPVDCGSVVSRSAKKIARAAQDTAPPRWNCPLISGRIELGPPQPPAGLAMSSHGALVDAALVIENATNCQASPSQALIRRSLVNLGVCREDGGAKCDLSGLSKVPQRLLNLTPGFIVEWTSAASAGTRAIVSDELYRSGIASPPRHFWPPCKIARFLNLVLN